MTTDSRSTQRSKILAVLVQAHGGWVPLPEITVCAAQYNARIFELRRLGLRIVNRTKEVDGVRHSWFRLESGVQPIQPQSVTPENMALPVVDECPTLFAEGRR